jgi:site-specific DNA-methyltransferase (adenine-specific)
VNRRIIRILTARPRVTLCLFGSGSSGLGKPYGVHDDSMPEESYLSWQGVAAKESRRVLAPDGHLFLNVGWNAQHPWRSPDVANRYRAHFILQQRIAWVKSIALDGSTLPEELRAAMHERQVGHFASLNSDRYLNPVFEDVWHFSATGDSKIDRTAPGVGVPYVWADQPARFGHHRQRHCRGNALHLPYKTVQSRADRDFHPAPYPVEFAEFFLRLAGLKPDDLVLDPFMGTGATLLAAQRLGLRAIGIDIDPAYCAAARRRLEEQDGIAALRLVGM